MAEWTIYNNTTPWGLLTPDQRVQMNKHDGWFEIFEGVKWRAIPPSAALGFVHNVYRAVRPAPTKPSINWDHVAGWVKWIARDDYGFGKAFEKKPYVFAGHWHDAGGIVQGLSALASYTPGTCDWKDSLVARPGTEDAK